MKNKATVEAFSVFKIFKKGTKQWNRERLNSKQTKFSLDVK